MSDRIHDERRRSKNPTSNTARQDISAAHTSKHDTATQSSTMSVAVATVTISSRRVTLAVFSSIPDIASTLQKAAPTLDLEVIEDEDALGGYGGTVTFDPTKMSASTRERLSQVKALITEPAVLAQIIKDNPQALPSLEWCQSTYAGVDPLFDTVGLELPLPFTLTRFAGKFGPPIAEWCLARIIGHERKFALTAQDQTQQSWAGSREVTRYRYLKDLTLTILGGAGDIGLCIGRVAQAFGMKTVGFGKTPRHPKDSKLPLGLDEYTTDLTHALGQGDYIISVVPSTATTRGLLSGDTLASAKKGAVFLNVGRGDIIGEEHLIHALDQGYISAAILDVFSTEPLPKESPLWNRKDVVVSPHVSGVTRAEDVPDIVLENYRRFINGEELLYKVDWSKGY